MNEETNVEVNLKEDTAAGTFTISFTVPLSEVEALEEIVYPEVLEDINAVLNAKAS